MARTRFPGISPNAFVSDTDRMALEALKKIPLLPQIVRKFFDIGIDRWLYCLNMSMSVRCGPKQFKTLYEIMRECCDILDMPEPELYVTNNPMPNAFAGGVERPYITLRSGIVDNLSDEQLFYLIGHELGHIKAEHVLYMAIGSLLFPLLELIGRRTFGLGDVATVALVIAWYEWSRQAEFTADRAGLLAAQSVNDSLDSLIMLAAGGSRLRGEMSREAFMDQARAYQDAGTMEQIGKVLIFLLMGHQFTHPMPVHRAQELERWALSGEFDKIMRGDYARVEQKQAV